MARRWAPNSSAFGMVTGFTGSTRALADTKVVETVPSAYTVRRYTTAPYATVDASQNPCRDEMDEESLDGRVKRRGTGWALSRGKLESQESHCC